MEPLARSHSTPMQQYPADPALRYHTAREMIAVPTLACYLQTLVGIGLWLLAPPRLARWLGRAGYRSGLHAMERCWARRVTRHLGIQLELSGLEHITRGQPYIITPLHEGFADILALLHLPLPMRFVARDELFGWQLLGPYLHDAGHICVVPERGSHSYRELLRSARAAIQQGESVVIFPQGTILGIETDFQLGAFALARAVSCPILPVALTGGHRVWEHPYSPRLRYGQRMSLRVLAPISVASGTKLDVEALRRTVRRQLKTCALSREMASPRHFVPARDGYWDGFAYRIDPDFPALAADVALHRQLQLREEGSEQGVTSSTTAD